MDKKIKKTAKIAIVTAIITIIILVCILTIFKFEYDKTGICSDPEKSFKWFINCVNPESLIKLIIYMSGLGVAPLILSNISSLSVLLSRYSNKKERNPYKNLAKLAFILTSLYELVLLLIFVLLIITIVHTTTFI